MSVWLSENSTVEKSVFVLANLFFRLRCRFKYRDYYPFFKNTLGFFPRNFHLYQVAFIHRSKSVVSGKGGCVNNERLEYLGDAVLGSMVADYLYRKYPNKEEGFLTDVRSKIVSRANLNVLAKKIGLAQFIQYDSRSNGYFKSKDGDGFEALVGAIYLDRGYDFTYSVVMDRLMASYSDIDRLVCAEWNYKSKLINWGQREHHKVSYEVVGVSFHGNRNQYDVQVKIDEHVTDRAVAFSIKSAEQLASEKTFKRLRQSDFDLSLLCS